MFICAVNIVMHMRIDMEFSKIDLRGMKYKIFQDTHTHATSAEAQKSIRKIQLGEINMNDIK